MCSFKVNAANDDQTGLTIVGRKSENGSGSSVRVGRVNRGGGPIENCSGPSENRIGPSENWIWPSENGGGQLDCDDL